MKTRFLRWATGLGLAWYAGSAWASHLAPAALNYQGVLRPDQGALTAGNYGMQFRIWADENNNSQVWARAFTVYVASNGTFDVALTDTGAELLAPPQTSDLFSAFSSGPRYLGLTVTSTPSGAVGSPRQIEPVQPFLSVPFAFMAQGADNADGMIGLPAAKIVAIDPQTGYLFGSNVANAAYLRSVQSQVWLTPASWYIPFTITNGFHLGYGMQCPTAHVEQVVVPYLSSAGQNPVGFGAPVRMLATNNAAVSTGYVDAVMVSGNQCPGFSLTPTRDGLFRVSFVGPMGVDNNYVTDFTIAGIWTPVRWPNPAPGDGGPTVREWAVPAGQTITAAWNWCEDTNRLLLWEFRPFGND